MKLKFTHFNVFVCDGVVDTCSCDFVKITDGDGTTLMDKSCGTISSDPSDPLFFNASSVMLTKTNTVDIFFDTDDRSISTGWNLSWTAVTPGQKATTFIVIN